MTAFLEAGSPLGGFEEGLRRRPLSAYTFSKCSTFITKMVAPPIRFSTGVGM
jgi:hypothetical protein